MKNPVTKNSKITDFRSKDVQKINSKVANESLLTISPETTESATINDKIKPQTLTETPPSIINTATPAPVHKEVKQKIITENDILVGLYQRRDLLQLSQSDRKEITTRQETLRKYKADLKSEVLCVQEEKGYSFCYVTGERGKGLLLRPIMR